MDAPSPEQDAKAAGVDVGAGIPRLVRKRVVRKRVVEETDPARRDVRTLPAEEEATPSAAVEAVSSAAPSAPAGEAAGVDEEEVIALQTEAASSSASSGADPAVSTFAGRRPDLDRERAFRAKARRREKRSRRLMVARTVMLMLAMLLVGLFSGAVLASFVRIPGARSNVVGLITVMEAELDVPLGSYTYEGRQTQISVREAIEESSTLEAVRNADGTYDVPSVDTVLAIARNRLLAADAEQKGIRASEEDARAYARDIWGTDDLSELAANYGMGEDRVMERLTEAATLRKLRDEVVSTQAIEEPEPPSEPSDGLADEMRPEYAAYIMQLVGDEWDANANSWSREDGPFYEQLKHYSVSNDAATYSAAQAAYYVARVRYAAQEQQIANEWTAYVNQILSQASVELGSLVA